MPRSPGRVRWLFAGTLAAACAGAACSTLLGIDTLTNATETADAAPPDVGVDAGPGCTPLHPPARSAVSDDDAGASYTLAMNVFGLGLEKSSTKDLYWDLDGVCTCTDPDAAERCARPTPIDPDTCDLADGRDGTGNRALQVISKAVPQVSDQTLAAKLEAGAYGAVISLRKYNGALYDSVVQVDIAPSFGTVVLQNGAPVVDAKGRLVNAPLAHDGNDLWSFDPTFASLDGALVKSTFSDPNAYVSDGVLVAHFPVLFMAGQFGITNENPVLFRLTDVVAGAKIESSGDGFKLTRGKLGGRIRAADMLRSFGVWTDPFGTKNEGICDGSTVYETIQAGLCQKLDVRSPAADDGKGLPCDALSFGILFGAEPAKVHGPVAYPYVPTTCFSGVVDTTPATTNACP